MLFLPMKKQRQHRRKRKKVARYTQDVVLNKPDDFVYFMMNDYLQKNGFSMSDWKGEPAYRAGDGFIEGYKYIKWSYANGVFHLEAWLKGTFGGEMGLDGFVGYMMKKPFKDNLTQLISLLQQTLPQEAYAQNGAASQTGDATTANGNTTTVNPGPIPVQTMDNYKAAQQALIFGILALVFFWWPIICLVLSVVAFSRARMGKASSKANLAKAGKICSIVALCITFGLYILNLVLELILVLQ